MDDLPLNSPGPTFEIGTTSTMHDLNDPNTIFSKKDAIYLKK